MHLDRVVPLGRSLDEYVRMFALSEADQRANILGVADGPASFNAELTACSGRVTSVDPIYAFSPEEIQKRFYDVLDDVVEQVHASINDWNWEYHHSPAGLRANRVRAMELFVADFAARNNTPGYVNGGLPDLPFANAQFDLALCSHFLFLYSAQLTLEFHVASLKEMLRVAREVRVFPLLSLNLERSAHLDAAMDAIRSAGHGAEIIRVDFEFQRSGNEMLVLKNA